MRAIGVDVLRRLAPQRNGLPVQAAQVYERRSRDRLSARVE
jgi:hypothetical protein